MTRCPTCNSHAPALHPACQDGGEVAICKDTFHGLVIEPMPPTVDRRPFDDGQPDGMLESDQDWARNNPEAVEWLADNHKAIRAALSHQPT